MALKKVKRPCTGGPEEVNQYSYLHQDLAPNPDDEFDTETTEDLEGYYDQESKNDHKKIINQEETNEFGGKEEKKNPYDYDDKSGYPETESKSNYDTSKSKDADLSDSDITVSYSNGKAELLRKSNIEAGIYDYQIKGINIKRNIDGKYGTYSLLIVDYFIAADRNKIQEVKIALVISRKQDSPYVLFLNKFAPIFEGESINIRQLIGLRGVCDISHYRSKDGNEYERLEILSVVK